ncbi:hypothetical protein ACFCV3_18325 [Kribbella sp. NPDC056345]|uniref:hypothetical protein n=1 Tax=Kribbella sp. NPDC056345 TaxID=3345789 RepID=UPI0035D7CA86
MSSALADQTAELPPGVTNGLRLRRVLTAMQVGSRPMVLVYWGVMLIAFMVGGLILQYLTDGTGNSVWDYGTQSPKYFSMAVGISLVPAYVNALVAQGVTRRMFSVAAGIFLTVAALLTAVIWVVGYQIERVVYDWQGWSQAMENRHLFSSTSEVGLIFAEFALLVVSHEATGWLLGVTFYRLGFWRGLAMIPLSLVPAAATEFLLVAQWLGGPLSALGYHRPPLAVAVPVVAIVTALGLYAGYRILQPMPLKPAKG